MNDKESAKNNDQIDLVELVQVVWKNKRYVLKVAGICMIFGLIIALISKTEYESSCRLLPESSDGISASLGGLGGLAGLAGFDLSSLGATSGVLTPELYPEIVYSQPFLDSLINTPVYFERMDTTISSFIYFKEVESPSLFKLVMEYTFGLPKKIFGSSEDEKLNDYNLIRYSKDDWEIIEDYKDRIVVFVSPKTGTIGVSVMMPDPVASAFLAELLVDRLTESVINYKIEKSQINLEFVEERFEEAKVAYELSQEQLANFTDKNRNIANSIVQNEYERLQNELDIAFEVYKGLATQLEQAKIKVKEETPVFTVLHPVQIPSEKAKPKRALIVVLSVFAGMIIGISIVLFKSFNNHLINNIVR